MLNYTEHFSGIGNSPYHPPIPFKLFLHIIYPFHQQRSLLPWSHLVPRKPLAYIYSSISPFLKTKTLNVVFTYYFNVYILPSEQTEQTAYQLVIKAFIQWKQRTKSNNLTSLTPQLKMCSTDRSNIHRIFFKNTAGVQMLLAGDTITFLRKPQQLGNVPRVQWHDKARRTYQ